MPDPELRATACAICGTFENATELYPANFTSAAFNPEVFSARRRPDRIHYRVVRCDTCGLVRSDPVADTRVLNDLYRRSDFTYADTLEGLTLSYSRTLTRVEAVLGHRGDLLEVGCGNGFFLEEARKRGYASVTGVEPSASAVERAPAQVRPRIVADVFREGLFEPSSFDVVCFFQTFDHLPEPRQALREAHRVLRPGGVALFVNHDVEALSFRLLGERSPIIDIEHTYLYSQATMRRVLEAEAFQVLRAGSAANTYPLEYLLHLAPLPARLKATLRGILRPSGLLRLRLTLNLGNLLVIARKPGPSSPPGGSHGL